VVSLVSGAVLLWLSSHRVELWPRRVEVVDPLALGLAVVLEIPYALARALRLQFALDPLVERSSQGRSTRVDRGLLYGSGLVSTFVVLVLPFKLGEVSRPWLLARAKEPGLDFPQALGAVAAERLLDGLAICGLLIVGLRYSGPLVVEGNLDLHAMAGWFAAAFGVGLLALLIFARWPERTLPIVHTVLRPLGDAAARTVDAVIRRLLDGIRGVMDLRQGVALVGWTLVYWWLTAAQLWLVLRASGLSLGLPEAAVIVAIVGLSVQLPGGPGQAGTFQVGMVVALGLFVTPERVGGPGSTFVMLMYGLTLAGSAGMAVPGLFMIAAAARRRDRRVVHHASIGPDSR